MAGDWIKMRADLQTHPKVVRIASALKADKLRVIGGLHAVWSLFDTHSEDGFLDAYSFDVIDNEIRWPGFAEAMASVSWLSTDGESTLLPEFDEHNGQSAKRRAQETKRKREERKAEEGAKGDRNPSASDADKKRSREEKRREEDIEPPPNFLAEGSGGGESAKPTKAGEVCKAIKLRGVAGVNPSNPELLALIAQGVEVETFEAAADVCAKATPPKGMAYLIGIVKRQLGEAATIASGAGMPKKAWDTDRPSIEAKGVELGLGKWNEADLSVDRETFPAYTARVRRAVEGEPA